MLKKIFLMFVLLNLLNHCDYKPVYSNQKKINYKILITSFNGDKDKNNSSTEDLRRNSNGNSDKIININFETKYTKDILAKNTAGNVTDYQVNVSAIFTIQKDDDLKTLKLYEKFNFQKMSDKYEEKNYELNIKRNLANSISQKLLLRLAMIK